MRISGQTATLAAGIVLLAVGLMAVPVRGAEEEPPATSFDYYITVGRAPDRHFFPCARIPAGSGFPTDPRTSGFYPYRMSPGDEHCVVVVPTQRLPIYWLQEEERHKKRIDRAAAALQKCRGLLPKIEDTLAQRRRLSGYLGKHLPEWREELRAAKLEAIRELDLDAGPEDLDVLAMYAELTEQKAAILRGKPAPDETSDESEPVDQSEEGTPADGGESEGTEPEEGPTAKPPALPEPEGFRAVPAPNDNGRRIALWWRALPSELQARGPARPAARPVSPEPPIQPEPTLTEAQAEALADIEGRLMALEPAREIAQMIADATGRVSELDGIASSLAQEAASGAAEFALSFLQLDRTARVHLAAVLSMEPEQVTPEIAARHLPDLKRVSAEAREKALAPDAGPEAHDRADALSHALWVARLYVSRSRQNISVGDIENDLLWQTREALGEFRLEPVEQPDGTGTRGEDLLAALAMVRDTGTAFDLDAAGQGVEAYEAALQTLESTSAQWLETRSAKLHSRLRTMARPPDDLSAAHSESVRLGALVVEAEERLKRVKRRHDGRTYHFRIATVPPGTKPDQVAGPTVSAAARAALFDSSQSVNLAFALVFAAAVVGLLVYVRRRRDVFVRKIAGLEAVDEAIGRATEMGKPALFVHGLSGVSDIAVLASINILARLARQVAEYDSDLLVANNNPIVYSLSQEVVQEGYTAAGRPDAFRPGNVMMLAPEQFPYVAAVTGIMSRRRPAANFFMGYFFAEALILAEVGAGTGAIQIAATDSFTQIPFFITTCDYTLMGEELYAAAAYLSRNVRMLATLKAQDFGKAILLTSLPLGLLLSNLGKNWIQVLFTAYEKGF